MLRSAVARAAGAFRHAHRIQQYQHPARARDTRISAQGSEESRWSSPDAGPESEVESVQQPRTKTKTVIIRNIKTTESISKALFARIALSKIAFACPSFRLRVVPDPGGRFSPHAEAPWLPMPPGEGTHKRRHLMIEVGRGRGARVGMGEGDLSSGRERDLGAGADTRALDTAPPADANDADPDADTSTPSLPTSPFTPLGPLFPHPLPRPPPYPPLPNPSHELELRTMFINAKKETHKSAVVRGRCRRRLQTALRTMFLEEGEGGEGRAILGREGRGLYVPRELARFVHTDHVYVFFPQPITFTAKMKDMAKDFYDALQFSSKKIDALARPAPSHPPLPPSGRGSFHKRVIAGQNFSGARQTGGGFSKKPSRWE